MQISVSSTLTVYHDGQFWVGLAEHVEDGRYGVARIVFGAEPSDEEILRFVTIRPRRASPRRTPRDAPARRRKPSSSRR